MKILANIGFYIHVTNGKWMNSHVEFRKVMELQPHTQSWLFHQYYLHYTYNLTVNLCIMY